MTTNAEFAAQLSDLTTVVTAVAAEVTKVGTETATLVQKVADLEAAIGNGADVPQPVLDAFAALKTQVDVVKTAAQAADDLVPDATPAP